MLLIEQINQDYIEALKAKDEVKVSTLRLVKGAIHNAEIEAGKPLDETSVGQVIAKQNKQREESINEYKKGGREDLAQKEQAEIEILKKYLPQQLSDEKITEIVQKAIAETHASSIADMGKVMGKVMADAAGKADGGKVSQIVKEKLS